MRKAFNQTTAKACKSTSGGFGKGNCPATLEPGLNVTIVGEKAGGTLLEIKAPGRLPGFAPNESMYVMAIFVEQDRVPQASGAPIKDIKRLDQVVKMNGFPNKQPNYIDLANVSEPSRIGSARRRHHSHSETGAGEKITFRSRRVISTSTATH